MTSVFYYWGMWRYAKVLIACLPVVGFLGIFVTLDGLRNGLSLADFLPLISFRLYFYMFLLLLGTVFISWLMYFDLKYSRLELSAEGIHFYQIGSYCFVDWGCVLGVEKRLVGARSLYVLKVDQSGVLTKGLLVGILKRTDLGLNIPLSPFGYGSRDGELSGSLKHFLPSLANE